MLPYLGNTFGLFCKTQTSYGYVYYQRSTWNGVPFCVWESIIELPIHGLPLSKLKKPCKMDSFFGLGEVTCPYGMTNGIKMGVWLGPWIMLIFKMLI